MLNAHASLILAAPLLLSLNSSLRPASDSADRARAHAAALRKCGNPIQQTALYFLDGNAVAVSALDSSVMKTSNVQYVSVTCLNPVDSTLMPMSNKAPGLSVVLVWTTTGPFARVEPALKAIVDAQTALFAKSGSYARDVATQPLPSLPSGLKVKFESTTTGWEATVWMDRALSPRCHTFGGDNKSGGMDDLTKQPVPAGKVVCNDS